MPTPTLILASTSPYRRNLLQRLLSHFEQIASHVDETPVAGEMPKARAQRLAHAKAQAIAETRQNAIMIGSDQVATLQGELLRKPGTKARTCEQLAKCSEKTVDFHTAVSIVNTYHYPYRTSAFCDTTRVTFRRLDADTIKRYVEQEQPFDCAGGFKCEGLGIALMTQMDTTDPTALIGLPLIELAEKLRHCGFSLP